VTETAKSDSNTADHVRPVVAAFDVDGTLTTRDCVVPFLRRVGGIRRLVLAIARRPIASVRAAVRRDRDRMKEVVVGGVFRGNEVAEVAEIGRSFAAHVEATMLRADTLQRLRWHQQQGHRTVFVSASLRPYLEPLARALGVEHVLCTDVVADQGRYTHVLTGPNCRAAEKVRRLRALLAMHGLDGADVWAYGDSDGDRELLAIAAHPIWTRGTTITAVPAEAA